jgi:hypothetical protein
MIRETKIKKGTRAMRKYFFLSGLIVLNLHPVAAVAQAPGADLDWPCTQRRAPTISAAAVWAGPDLAKAGAWDDDSEAAALAQKLASRRTPLEEADGLLDEFATKAGAEKDVRLTRVFAGVVELINAQRDRVMEGIVRYARGQNKLAEKVRKESEAVADAQEAEEATDKTEEAAPKSTGAVPPKPGDEAENSLKWDKRIFEERSRSLTYVCETPGLLEQRLFEIARRIQQRL